MQTVAFSIKIMDGETLGINIVKHVLSQQLSNTFRDFIHAGDDCYHQKGKSAATPNSNRCEIDHFPNCRTPLEDSVSIELLQDFSSSWTLILDLP